LLLYITTKYATFSILISCKQTTGSTGSIEYHLKMVMGQFSEIKRHISYRIDVQSKKSEY